MNISDHPSPVSRGATVVFVLSVLVAIWLLAVGRNDYPDLHTILDTGMCLLSGVLAFVLWDMGTRIDRMLPRAVAVSFAVTSLLELIHVLVTVEWTGALAPIAQAKEILRPATWPVAAYVLPLGLLGALWAMRRGAQRVGGFAWLVLALGPVLFPVFYTTPRYTPPIWLGITRPMLLWVPLLWAGIGVASWRWRAADRLLPALARTAGVLALAHTAMLYSQAPHDTEAMVAHLGKVCGYLLLLIALMQAASSDMRELIRAERELSQAKESLEQRVTERTAQLASLNETLAASERQYRLIFEESPLPKWIYDLETLQFLAVNKAAQKQYGYTEAEFLQMTIRDIRPEEDVAALEADVARARGNGSRASEWRHRKKAGALIHVIVNAHDIQLHGRAARLVVAQDITARKKAEEELRASEARFRTLAESLPQLVWTCRPDGYCDYLSRQWVEYTGRPAEEQLGYGWAEHLHPEDRARVQTEWEQAAKRGDFFDVEFRIRRANGAYRWFKTRAVPLRDATGQIVKWFGSNTDVEDYKLSEQKLQTHLGRLNLLHRITRAIGERQDLESIFQVVVRSLEDNLPIDLCCMCLYDATAHLLTVTRIGLHSEALATELALTEQAKIPIDENGLSRCVRGQLVHEADILDVQFPFPQRLARAGLRSLVFAPLLVESKVFGVLIGARRTPHSFSSGECEFLKQLSEHAALAAHQAQLYAALQRAYDDLRQTQQAIMQQERLRALGQMASGIAHDINNAISPAALYAESLLEKEPNLSARAREQLAIVQHALDDVAQTVARMREFYRQREPQLMLAAVDLNRLVPQVVELSRARWHDMPQQRGIVIDLRRELAPNLPAIMGVESEIREALINLVFNAVDAMPEGGTLTLRTRLLADAAPAQAAVEVVDTGVGMDADTRRRCMEPFFTTKGERGTGLGLAMVYGMVQRHSAEIQIESAVGRGTTMRLSFAAPARIVSPPQPAAAASPRSRLRLLIIDDDPLLIQSLRDTLEADGHVIATANDGRSGIDAFHAALASKEPFAAVITDLGMPYVDGRKVASAIKAASPDTPVILLTGWGQRLVAEGDVPVEVDLVLSKPPKLRELREALAQCCPDPQS